ncbi:carbohydrate ABC transporter permease [Bauldia sp.]|uniref:carbohydrate ABC transporter permease n=1 Tax=Bauldia sp. TaxID=2575872 RepID=UPI003BAAB1A5
MAVNNKRSQYWAAAVLVAPFVIAQIVLFLYPTSQMVRLSFTDAPLIGEGSWVGLDNYARLIGDRLFLRATWNTFYFVLLTVVPTTLLGLMIGMMVTRLKGWLQAAVLACFFLPFVLPITVVTTIWEWVLDLQFGIAQYLIEPIVGERVSVFRTRAWAMPGVAIVTIWWTIGFTVLLFVAGLRNISPDLYEAASLDGASAWEQFRYITWPLIWPVTALVLTIQLIAQLKIFDQVYILTEGGPANSTYVLVQYIFRQAFQLNKGGYASTVAVFLFFIIVALSVFQYQVLRTRDSR